MYAQYISTPPGGNNASSNEAVFTYDNHPNPLARLTAFSAFFNQSNNYFTLDPQQISTNNLSSAGSPVSPNSSDNYSYQYNNAGFPVRCTISSPDVSEIIYKYKSL